jgi:hypothetical protein
MHEPRRLPALFHRVFLSHLLVVLLCLITALILHDYLFVDGISHFLLRSPVILVPVMLALMGIVGLLALWTAGAAAMPLDRAADALREPDAAQALERLLPSTGVDEVARLVDGVRQHIAREPAQRPLYLRLDRHGNIADGDVDTAARLGLTPDALRRRNLRDLLPDTAAVQALLAAQASTEADTAMDAGLVTFVAAAGRRLHARCLLYSLSGNEILLIGFPARTS